MQWPFDVLIVTAPTERSALAYHKELETRLRPQVGPSVTLLSIHDPEAKRVGSGGGTLNGLYHVKRTLASRGITLKEKRTVMIHSGGDSQRSPTNSVCGKAWSALNSVHGPSGLCNTPIDLLLRQLCNLFNDVPKGSLVVASSDVMLILPVSMEVDWASVRGVTGLATMAPLALGPNHGVYVTEAAESGPSIQRVTVYLQKASVAELQAKGAVVRRERGDDNEARTRGHEEGGQPQVAIDTGVVYFSPEATDVLSRLLDEELFQACTYGGVGRGMEALRLELYSDMLLALSGGVGQSYEAYLRMDGKPSERVLQARQRLWECFSSMPFHTVTPADALFGHLGTTEELIDMMAGRMLPFADAYSLQPLACCHLGPSVRVRPGAVVLNSVALGHGGIGPGAVVEHCYLRGQWDVASGSLVSGLYFAGQDVQIPPGLCVQETRLSPPSSLPQPPLPPTPSSVSTLPPPISTASASDLLLPPQPYVVVVLGVHDSIKADFRDSTATVCGRPWSSLLSSLHISPEELWPSGTGPCNLWTARLFPLLHPSTPEQQQQAAWWLAKMAQGEAPSAEVLDQWRGCERLSLCEILARAEPGAEFGWRRQVGENVQRRRACREEAWSRLQQALDSMPHPDCVPLAQLCDDTGATTGWLVDRLEAWSCAEALPLCVLPRVWALLSSLCLHLAHEDGEPLPLQASGHDVPDEAWLKLLSGLETVGASGSHPSQHQRNQNRSKKNTPPPVSKNASNNRWPQEGADCRAVCRGLVELRQAWMGPFGESANVEACTPRGLGRWHKAARHYETAFHAVIRIQTATAAMAVTTRDVQPIRKGQVVTAEASARVDLAGGWSDTPPISYEMGGEVLNLAIRIHGRKPMGAKVGLIESPELVFLLEHADGDITEVRCRSLRDLMDYSNPLADAALLKCAILYCGLVHLESSSSLQEQLLARLGAGLQVHSWSRLPTGSGLGTSSILVGAVLAAVGRACGRAFDEASLNHAVLQLEQMMSTGGGWQDQIGGLIGGMKVGRSKASLPLIVDYDKIPLTPLMRQKLEDHLVVVYTGKQRLARDLLQNVLRRYYARGTETMKTVGRLVANAKDAVKALHEEDIVATGACLSKYWDQKKVMAGGPGVCEPQHITALMDALRPLAHGMSICGAGGGGFLAIISKDPVSSKGTLKTLEAVVKRSLTNSLNDGVELAQTFPLVSAITVEDEGLSLTVGQELMH